MSAKYQNCDGVKDFSSAGGLRTKYWWANVAKFGLPIQDYRFERETAAARAYDAAFRINWKGYRSKRAQERRGDEPIDPDQLCEPTMQEIDDWKEYWASTSVDSVRDNFNGVTPKHSGDRKSTEALFEAVDGLFNVLGVANEKLMPLRISFNVVMRQGLAVLQEKVNFEAHDCVEKSTKIVADLSRMLRRKSSELNPKAVEATIGIIHLLTLHPDLDKAQAQQPNQVVAMLRSFLPLPQVVAAGLEVKRFIDSIEAYHAKDSNVEIMRASLLRSALMLTVVRTLEPGMMLDDMVDDVTLFKGNKGMIPYDLTVYKYYHEKWTKLVTHNFNSRMTVLSAVGGGRASKLAAEGGMPIVHHFLAHAAAMSEKLLKWAYGLANEHQGSKKSRSAIGVAGRTASAGATMISASDGAAAQHTGILEFPSQSDYAGDA